IAHRTRFPRLSAPHNLTYPTPTQQFPLRETLQKDTEIDCRTRCGHSHERRSRWAFYLLFHASFHPTHLPDNIRMRKDCLLPHWNMAPTPASSRCEQPGGLSVSTGNLPWAPIPRIDRR